MLLQAAADDAVQSIVLDVDSPGGVVSGIFDAADLIARVGETKTVWAVANVRALSAAYVLASAADKVFMPRNAYAGSLGTLIVRADRTAADARDGVAYHVITSGGAKGDGFEHKAATEAELGRLQAEVDRAAGMLFAAVGQRRGMAPEAVAALNAEVFSDDRAQAAGLVDGIATKDDTVLELATRPRAAAPKKRGMRMEGSENVVSLDDHRKQVNEARGAARLEAAAEFRDRLVAITDLCTLAGCPDRAATLAASDKTLEVIRKELVDAKAKSQSDDGEINSHGRGIGSGIPERVGRNVGLIDACKAIAAQARA
jgi:ClpP class serine protease